MTPLPAAQVLDLFFLEARSKLLDLAAVLDRIDRGADARAIQSDPRLATVRRAAEVLLAGGAGRAEKVQQLFSLDYDPNWPRPEPR